MMQRALNGAKISLWSALLSLAAISLNSQPLWAQEEPALSPGSYKLEMILASTTKVPFFGSSKSASKSISLVEIKRDASGFIQSHKVCDFRVMEDSKFIKMIFPEKFITALANHSYAVQIEKEGQNWRYRADLGIERIGYRPVGDDLKLPEKIDDPAVFDWDSDGLPAATLKISIPLLPDGELYVVQRGRSILNGRIVHPGKVEGTIDVQSFAQRVLGAKPGFLNASPEITPDSKESRFVMSPVPNGSSCEMLRNAPK